MAPLVPCILIMCSNISTVLLSLLVAFYKGATLHRLHTSRLSRTHGKLDKSAAESAENL